MRWAEITISCPSETEEAVCQALLDAGCGGTMTTGTGPVSVQGSLPEDEYLPEKLQTLRDRLNTLPDWGLAPVCSEPGVQLVDEQDWAEAWKKHYKPVKPGRILVVKPSWEVYAPNPEEKVLALDPGMAFGTGGHPTTRLCMEFLEDTVQEGMRVADIGTGSGILSIAAALLGAEHVWATDSDSLPRRIAAANIAENQMEGKIEVLELDEFYQQAQQCDIVTANIVANTILELLPQISGMVKTGGAVIVGGIVEEHRDLLHRALALAGFEDIQEKTEDIWVCFLAVRTSNPVNMPELINLSRSLPPLGANWA